MIRTRKAILLLAAFFLAASFWVFLVQYTLPRAKMAKIELEVMSLESKMSPLEKLLHLNKLKKKEKKNALKGI